MRKFLFHIAMLPLAALALAGCVQHNEPAAPEPAVYTVRVSVEPGVRTDSVALYLVNADYGRLLSVPASGKSDGRVWTFTGQIAEPQIALLRVAGAKMPLYLIVEPCLTEVGVNQSNTVVWGGKLNHYYYAQSALIDSMQAQLRQLRLTYNRALRDSSLTRDGESSILRADKRTHEACQQLLVKLMRRPDAVGRLVRDQRFGLVSIPGNGDFWGKFWCSNFAGKKLLICLILTKETDLCSTRGT